MNKRVLFICGSPRRHESCSFQIARYVSYFLDDGIQSDFIHVNALKLNRDISEDDPGFLLIQKEIDAADVVIWTYGVYVGFVPAQLKLLFDYLMTIPRQPVFPDKLSAAICTSERLLDDLSLSRVKKISELLGMTFLSDLSIQGNAGLGYEAEPESEFRARVFAETINRAVALDVQPLHSPNREQSESKNIGASARDRDERSLPAPMVKKDQSQPPLLLVFDSDPENDPQLQFWRRAFQNRVSGPISELILDQHRIKPCTGCLWCNQFDDGTCVIRDDLQTIRNVLHQHKHFGFISTASGTSVGYGFKVVLDRLWVDIHQRTLAGTNGFVVIIPQDNTGAAAESSLLGFLRLMGVRVVHSIVDTDIQSRDFTGIVDWMLNSVFNSSVSENRIPGTYDYISQLNGIRDIIFRWGYILRSDYLYYKQNHPVPLRIRISNFFYWWLFGTPRRFRFILNLGRKAAMRRRYNRLKQVLVSMGKTPPTFQEFNVYDSEKPDI